jgi:hypothetical protein
MPSDEIEIDLRTATELHLHTVGSLDDDDWMTETLYRLTDGRYALRRETGMNHADSGASSTKVLAVAAAQAWLKQHGSPAKLA